MNNICTIRKECNSKIPNLEKKILVKYYNYYKLFVLTQSYYSSS